MTDRIDYLDLADRFYDDACIQISRGDTEKADRYKQSAIFHALRAIVDKLDAQATDSELSTADDLTVTDPFSEPETQGGNEPADVLEAMVAHLAEVAANHPDPRCEVHDDDPPITCGWKHLSIDLLNALGLEVRR